MNINSNNQTIRWDRHGFILNGKHHFILCASCFYFRLDRGDWLDRLDAVKKCGFNTVDVYVPWNFHEVEDGHFNFEGSKDLARYLDLCHQVGLYVYLRPGPYICNEWDGGGLPAWLFVNPQVHIRQNNPVYLNYVRRYLNKINEIVRPRQFNAGGPIILYQLENELDFYPCEDPRGYIKSLQKMVREDGICIPLTACIGDRTKIRKAHGLVNGVLPSPNIYGKGYLEQKALHAFHTIHLSNFDDGTSMVDLPMFVTEMSRDDLSMRRILSAGFNGLGPFNFVGGCNFDLTNGTNNWGGRSFIAATYGNNNPVTATGFYSEDWYRARLLAGFINCFEQELLQSEPIVSTGGGPSCTNSHLGSKENAEESGRIYSRISLDGKTVFVFAYNGTSSAKETHIKYGNITFPKHSKFIVPAQSAPIIPLGVELIGLPVKVRLTYSTLEIFKKEITDEETTLYVYGEAGTVGEIYLSADKDTISFLNGPARFYFETDGLILCIPVNGLSEIKLAIGDYHLKIKVFNRIMAARYELELIPKTGNVYELKEAKWAQFEPYPIPKGGIEWHGDAIPLERFEIFQGAAWYTAFFTAKTAFQRLTLPRVSDIISVYLNDSYIRTLRGDGMPLEIIFPRNQPEGEYKLLARVEIWGHSNFHDEEWPAAKLGSLRGLDGPLTVNDNQVVTNWCLSPEKRNTTTNAQESSFTGWAHKGGERKVLQLKHSGKFPQGGTLYIDGFNCFGEVWAQHESVGRFILGPQPDVVMAGGNRNLVYLPGRLIQNGLNLELKLFGTDYGYINSVKFEERLMQ